MGHFKSIGGSNFRTFRSDFNLELGPVNILTGKNGSGKSSILKEFLILKNLFAEDIKSEGNISEEKRVIKVGVINSFFPAISKNLITLDLHKTQLNYGGFTNFINNNSDKEDICFNIPFNIIGFEDTCQLKLKYKLAHLGGIDRGKLVQIKIIFKNEFSEEEVLSEFNVLNGDSNIKFKFNFSLFKEKVEKAINRHVKYINLKTEIENERYNGQPYVEGWYENKITQLDKEFPGYGKGYESYLYETGGLKINQKGNGFQPFAKSQFVNVLYKMDFNKSIFDYSIFEEPKSKKSQEALEMLKSLFDFDNLDDLKSIFKLEEEKLLATEYVKEISGFQDNPWKKIETIFGFDFNSWMINPTIHFSQGGFSEDGEYIESEDEYYDYSRAEINPLVKDNLIIQLLKSIGSDLYKESDNSRALNSFLMIIHNESFAALRKSFESVSSSNHLNHKSKRVYFKQENLNSDYDFLYKFIEKQSLNIEPLEEFLKRSLRLFEINDSLDISLDKETSIITVNLKKDKIKGNITDQGTGISKIVALIIDVYCFAEVNFKSDPQKPKFLEKTYLVEEPETGLHPGLQSKLADFFVDAFNTLSIQFIVETHSEYLIRKLQFLTGNSTIETGFAKIYYFNKDIVDRQIYEINILTDGSLDEDFGTGFTDESLKWQLELFHLKNRN
jgi:predicted ATPase